MKALFCAFLFLATFQLHSQPSQDKPSKQVRRYLDEVVQLIRNNALYSDSIDWKNLEAKVSALSKGLSTTDDCMPVIDTILMELRKAGDRHSGFIDKNNAKQLTSKNYTAKSIESRKLDGDIGYIKVPMFASIDLSAGEAFASEIQTQIQQLDENHAIKGWIVDLRGNNGGNVHPMIKGLSAMIGDGVYGYVLYRQQAMPMSTENGQAGYIKLISPYHVKDPSVPIAVLIDSATASSGEFTAIAFKQLPNVRFFGQPSAGYTTSNQTFPLPDGAYLYLATSYMADRKKNKYLPNIVPDVIIQLQVNEHRDPVIEASTGWLLLLSKSK